ncbi:MAG: adenosine deaminase [Chlorobi bacterium]|nr:adenosine deaminase [Chlorobiota bacterium]MCI0716355.1 adenosine deaminase [Chlorobiota bacterium]
MPGKNTISFLEAMPKVELHLHLEGAIPLEAMWNLAEKYSGTSEVISLKELKAKFNYVDFPHFIKIWIWKNKFIREYEDFTFIAGEVAKDLIRQNIKYAEIFYSPADHKSKNLNSQKISEAVFNGIKLFEKEIEINLIADLVRDFGPENGMVTLSELNEVKHMKVVGIGIGGSEQHFPPEAFKKVYSRARDLNFRTSAHAGEAAGSESIWGVINELNTERIGHGTRAYEDENLIEYLAEKKIPIEMCPISNVKTGVVKSIEEHPVKDYYKRGLKVFLNTDDPMMFNNSLAEEYALFIEKLGFDLSDVKKLMLNATDSAWCSESKKEKLRNLLKEYYLKEYKTNNSNQ